MGKFPVRGSIRQVVDLAAEAIVCQPTAARDPTPAELPEAARPFLVAGEGVGLDRRPRQHLEGKLGEALDGVALEAPDLPLPRLGIGMDEDYIS